MQGQPALGHYMGAISLVAGMTLVDLPRLCLGRSLSKDAGVENKEELVSWKVMEYHTCTVFCGTSNIGPDSSVCHGSFVDK